MQIMSDEITRNVFFINIYFSKKTKLKKFYIKNLIYYNFIKQ